MNNNAVKHLGYYSVVLEGPESRHIHAHPIVVAACKLSIHGFRDELNDSPVSTQDIGVMEADGTYSTVLEALCEFADPEYLHTFLTSPHVTWPSETYPIDGCQKAMIRLSQLSRLLKEKNPRSKRNNANTSSQPQYESTLSCFLLRLSCKRDEADLLENSLQEHVHQLREVRTVLGGNNNSLALSLSRPYVKECLDVLFAKASDYVLLWHLTYWLEMFFKKSSDLTEADLQYIQVMSLAEQQVVAVSDQNGIYDVLDKEDLSALRRNTGGFSSVDQYYDAVLLLDLEAMREGELKSFREKLATPGLSPEEKVAAKEECREKMEARTAKLQRIHKELMEIRRVNRNPHFCLSVTEDKIRNLQADDPLSLTIHEDAAPSLLERLWRLDGGYDGMNFLARGHRAMFYRLDEERVRIDDAGSRELIIDVTRRLEAAFVKRIRSHMNAGTLDAMLAQLLRRVQTSPPCWQKFAIQAFQTLRNLNHKLLRTTSGWYVSDVAQIMQLDPTGSIMLLSGKNLTEQALESEAAAGKAKGILEENVRVAHLQSTFVQKVQLAQMCFETTMVCGTLSHFKTSRTSQESYRQRLLALDNQEHARSKQALSKIFLKNVDLVICELDSIWTHYEPFLDRQEANFRKHADDLRKRFPNLESP